MNWHYVKDNTQTGPVDQAALEALFRAGTINASTLVWSPGMESWLPYSEARARQANPPATDRCNEAVMRCDMSAMSDVRGTIVQLVFQIVYFAVYGAYSIFFVGKYGATPGKMACKIKVVDETGAKIGYGRATGRFFAEFLSGLLCYIGYIMVAFDEEKRALHDRICNTRVIYK